ncbi:ATP-dependent DNA helicase RecG [Hydrogenimonas sp.]|nr:ATP-dependent DNA helicase RecG [Hydrogenimonas sp.]
MRKSEIPAKAGFSSLLELAVNIPVSYSDTRLSKEVKISQINTIEAEILSVSRPPKRLQATVRTPICDRTVEITVFHPKQYHNALFKPGMRHFLQGKIERFGSRLQMVNPKIVKRTGEIVPKYRGGLRSDLHRGLVERAVTVETLMEEGLDRVRAELIVRAHRPDGKWYELYLKHGGVGPRTVEALKFAEALDYFSRMMGRRIRFEAKKRLAGSIEPFLQRLPFELTESQKRAIADIKADLNSALAARRMVVGDVGSGKTMVILAAAMTAYPDLSILMAPTSILARQLYEEAKRWLPEYMNIALVTQGGEIGEIGDANFIIGTHALLYRDLPEAQLVMVDEQHRFGTEQRNILEKMHSGSGAKPHFLQFSATPIPRTQAMLDSALIDISIMESAPFVKDVTTQIVGRRDFAKLKDHIAKEISQKRQVLVVYPLVEESEHIGYLSLEESEEFWRRSFDGVYVTHGKDRQKEEVLQEFAQKGNILLTTTVIEVGISLPRLSTIVIAGAERMGLATLHQLRGRVGRTGLKSYCFLFTNDTGNERLKAFVKTKSGFEIAKLDLKFRKSGDILGGKIQSGREFKWLDMAEDEEIVEMAKEAAAERLGLSDWNQ